LRGLFHACFFKQADISFCDDKSFIKGRKYEPIFKRDDQELKKSPSGVP